MCFVYRGSEKESGKSSVKFRVSFVGMTMLRLPAKRNCAVEESGSGPRKRSPSVEVLEAYLYHRLRRVSIFDGLVSGVPVQDFNTDCGSPQFAVQSGGGWWPRPKKREICQRWRRFDAKLVVRRVVFGGCGTEGRKRREGAS